MTAPTVWYVVVERLDMQDKPLPPYVLGPLNNDEVDRELNSDDGIVFCWLTIDAKNENYQAIDCLATDYVPKNGILIHPN